MDILEMLLRFALTGKFEGWNAAVCDNAKFEHHYCSLNVLIEPDTIAKIENTEEVKKLPSIYAYSQMMYEGDTVKQAGTTEQIAFKFSMEADSRDALIRDIKYIQETLKICNKEGENLVMKLW